MWRSTRRAQSAFTLIELLVVIAIAGIVLTLVAPSFREMILMQRVRSVNAQLVTDLQFARSEAVTRNTNVRIRFLSNAAMTCYSIFTFTTKGTAMCDCQSATPCTDATLAEVRTVRIPSDSMVGIVPFGAGIPDQFAFDWKTGVMFQDSNDADVPTVLIYETETSANSSLKLRTTIDLGGRPTVCAPTGSKMQVTSCP